MTTANVVLWGTKIGTVMFNEKNGLSSFEYDSNFLDSGIEVSPICMPLSNRVYEFPELPRRSFHGLPGMLADSLPDKFGTAVIDAWLQSQGRTSESLNPVERLCYTGSRGMGALEYNPARSIGKEESQNVNIDQLVEVASNILKDRESMHISVSEHAMQDIIRVGTSAGGARAKAIIAWNEETGDIRSGQINAGDGYDYWLIKFDGVTGNKDKEKEDGPQYTRIEYAYYLMAKDAGIQMSECRLYEESNRYHFMTKRFDREEGTGKKLHMQSLGGIAHIDYNQPGMFGYEQTASVMRKLRLSKPEIEQFFSRMVFNVICRNQDDHVKNISFLMDRKGKWSLSPAYDVTYAYSPDGMWTGTHQMTINGKQDKITVTDLRCAAMSMGVKNADAADIIDRVRQSAAKWSEFAERAKVNEKTMRKIVNTFLNI